MSFAGVIKSGQNSKVHYLLVIYDFDLIFPSWHLIMIALD
jgi:hypothetical protein